MSTNPTEQVLAMAAADPALPDDAFVMVSRALNGRDPLTGEQPPAPKQRFFVARDHAEDEALWVGTDPDTDCQLVGYRFQFDTMHPALWPTVVAALDGKEA